MKKLVVEQQPEAAPRKLLNSAAQLCASPGWLFVASCTYSIGQAARRGRGGFRLGTLSSSGLCQANASSLGRRAAPRLAKLETPELLRPSGPLSSNRSEVPWPGLRESTGWRPQAARRPVHAAVPTHTGRCSVMRAESCCGAKC